MSKRAWRRLLGVTALNLVSATAVVRICYVAWMQQQPLRAVAPEIAWLLGVAVACLYLLAPGLREWASFLSHLASRRYASRITCPRCGCYAEGRFWTLGGAKDWAMEQAALHACGVNWAQEPRPDGFELANYEPVEKATVKREQVH